MTPDLIKGGGEGCLSPGIFSDNSTHAGHNHSVYMNIHIVTGELS